jgi:hypothetical protein
MMRTPWERGPEETIEGLEEGTWPEGVTERPLGAGESDRSRRYRTNWSDGDRQLPLFPDLLTGTIDESRLSCVACRTHVRAGVVRIYPESREVMTYEADDGMWHGDIPVGDVSYFVCGECGERLDEDLQRHLEENTL